MFLRRTDEGLFPEISALICIKENYTHVLQIGLIHIFVIIVIVNVFVKSQVKVLKLIPVFAISTFQNC